MKKIVEVTMTFEVELDIADSYLTPEYIKRFESYMFDVNGQPEGIFEHVAYQFAQQSDPDFVEGVGRTEWADTGLRHPEAVIKYRVSNLDVETEVKV